MYFELYGLLQALKLNNAVQSRNRFTGHCMWQAVRSTCKSSLSLFSSLYLGIGVAGAKFWACEEFLPKFPQTCSQKSKESGLQKKSLHFLFGHHFCKINSHTAIFRRFAHFYQKKKKFCLDFRRFWPDFHQLKIFGGCKCTLLVLLCWKQATRAIRNSSPRKNCGTKKLQKGQKNSNSQIKIWAKCFSKEPNLWFLATLRLGMHQLLKPSVVVKCSTEMNRFRLIQIQIQSGISF